MSAVHLQADQNPLHALCRTRGLVETTRESSEVTCKRCLHLIELKVEEHVEKAIDFATRPEQAVGEERNLTRREVMAFISEGDLDLAIIRMQRGFERQCRLSGLGSHINQTDTKESAWRPLQD